MEPKKNKWTPKEEIEDKRTCRLFWTNSGRLHIYVHKTPQLTVQRPQK